MAVTDCDGRDDDNRAAVAGVPTGEPDLVSLALRVPHKAADGVLRGLKRHPWPHAAAR